MIAGIKDCLESELIVESKSAELKDGMWAGLMRDRLPDHLGGRRCGQACHDSSTASRDLGYVFDDCDAGFCCLMTASLVDVIADHAPAALDEVRADRAAHNSEADDADALFFNASAAHVSLPEFPLAARIRQPH
ncbi:hypothetical protein [Bradyrhizobium sp. BRP22]|uniref:hypothetical protein n=1 Tax=Bradyrhizobium sp. BRP22 TaxID=2793821 RepID=UPI00201C7708|nr:hypothetical protein [Bradyrhizobium sp. BRP22]